MDSPGNDELIYLGHDEMDRVHGELHELLKSAAACHDARSLAIKLDLVIEHTRDHFSSE